MTLTTWMLLAAALAPVPEHAVVLLYHHVDAATPAVTSTAPADFAAHLDLLQAEGCRVTALPQVVAALRDPATQLPDRAVALTFDDGYRSVHAAAFPLLRQRGWPFTVFVCPDDVDAGRGPVCTWDQLREMAAAGATIASHGLRHEHLQRLGPGEDRAAWRRRVRAELLAAQRRIEAEIGRAPPLLAYPYGEWSPDLAALVADLGWTAFGQHSGAMGPDSDFLALPRFAAAGRYAAVGGLREKLRSLPLPLRKVEPADPQVVLEPGTRAGRRPDLRLALDPAAGPWHGLKAYEGGTEVAVSLTVGRDPTAVVHTGGPAAAGRIRTNITAPSAWPGRWYWHSHLWIVGEEHRD